MAKSTSSYDDNVFINCPFDKPYKPTFNAIVFAIHDAGFILRRVGATRAELDTPEYYPDYVNFVVEWLIEQEKKAARRQR